MVQSGAETSLACATGVPTVVGMGGPWRIEYYADEFGRAPFRRWFEHQSDAARDVVSWAIERRLAIYGVDVCSDHWGRNLGGGLYELRVRRRALLLRVFFAVEQDRVVLLLGGYDKGAQPKRQSAEIARARRCLAEHRRRRNVL